MKTQISKLAAIDIIENAIIYQTLYDKLSELFPADITEYAMNFAKLVDPIFNTDLGDAEMEEFDMYWKAFCSGLDLKEDDTRKKAEIAYNSLLAVCIKEEERAEKTEKKGLLSIVRGETYKIQGNFQLET